MINSILEHWILALAIVAALLLLWVAAILSKYIRLLLNILRDTPTPPLAGPLGFEKLEGRPVAFRAYDGTVLSTNNH